MWPQMAVTFLLAEAELGVPVAKRRALPAELGVLAQITTTQGAQFVTAEAEAEGLGMVTVQADRRLAAAVLVVRAILPPTLARLIPAVAAVAAAIPAKPEARELSLYGIRQPRH